jgi:ribosomal protein S27AE
MNEGFYYRTYQKAGETVEKLAFQCARCHVSVVSFEDESKASVWHCGKRHLFQPVIQKSFLASFFSSSDALPRVKAKEPVLVLSLHEDSDEAYS